MIGISGGETLKKSAEIRRNTQAKTPSKNTYQYAEIPKQKHPTNTSIHQMSVEIARVLRHRRVREKWRFEHFEERLFAGVSFSEDF